MQSESREATASHRPANGSCAEGETAGRPGARLKRADARDLLTGTDRIFIAYSHSDLRAVRGIYRRLLKLRKGKDRSSVFLDQESLRAGENVTPSVVEGVLAISDVVLVVCGKTTATSTTVMREIDLAMVRHSAGEATILPVMLKAHIALPPQLDYRIQGIFLTDLFPEIAWLRWAIALAALVLLGLVGYFANDSLRSSAQTRAAKIDLSLEQDARERFPTNLERRPKLEQLLQPARELHHREDEIRSLLAQIPEQGAGLEILAPDSKRERLVVSADGKFLVVGEEQSVEVYDLGSISLDPPRVVSLSSVSSRELPEEDDKEWYHPTSPEGSLSTFNLRRAPSLLRSLRVHPFLPLVCLETVYRNFAIVPPYPVPEVRLDSRGGEKEWLCLDPKNGNISSAGLSQALTKMAEGEDGTQSWYEIGDASPRSLERLWPLSLAKVTPPLFVEGGESGKVEFLAADRLGGAFLLAIRDSGAFPDFEDVLDGLLDFRLVVIHLEADGGFKRFSVTPDESEVVLPPGARDRRNGLSEEVEAYAPAALDWKSRTAVLRGKVVRIGEEKPNAQQLSSLAKLDWTKVESTSFVSNGEFLVVSQANGTQLYVRLSNGEIHRQFEKPPDAIAVSLTPDGSFAYVLKSDRAVWRWDTRRFGPDGWAANRGDESLVPPRNLTWRDRRF